MERSRGDIEHSIRWEHLNGIINGEGHNVPFTGSVRTVNVKTFRSLGSFERCSKRWKSEWTKHLVRWGVRTSPILRVMFEC
jgi:hypothetical protein